MAKRQTKKPEAKRPTAAEVLSAMKAGRGINHLRVITEGQNVKYRLIVSGKSVVLEESEYAKIAKAPGIFAKIIKQGTTQGVIPPINHSTIEYSFVKPAALEIPDAGR